VSGGEVTVTASLAGWREVSATFRIEGAADNTLLEERWDASWPARWITFGDPLPTVTTGPEGVRGFWNRGDGVYESFGLLRRAFDPSAGLGVEVLLSTPLTRPTWLRGRITLVPSVDTGQLVRTPKSGAAAGFPGGREGCGVGYPPADGAFGRDNVGVTSAVSVLVPVPEHETSLSAGSWWRVRIQLLPDGRCGVAINGRPLWLSPEPVDVGLKYWLRLGDASADARILHGPLTVWEGVRTDIDWTIVDRERVR